MSGEILQADAVCVLNQKSEPVKLENYRGKWVVLYFYPKDNTPGCTREANDFTEYKEEFDKLGAVIAGVSGDSVKSHTKFIEKQGINFDLLSDENHELLKAYRVLGEKKLYGREFLGIIRTTVLLDPEGNEKYRWDNVKVAGHAEEVLKKLRELTNQE